MMEKLSIALIFGGKSGEHEVSRVSASSIFKHINKDKYDIHTIGITKDGNWLYYKGSEENIANGNWENLAQGVFEISNIPYVGCGVLASSVGMDKLICKKVFSQIGLPQVDYTYTNKWNFELNQNEELDKIEKELNYPIFVKPANMGSSVGITKVSNREELREGIKEALKYDRRIVLEQGINAREIEVAVLGNDDVKSSIAGEIIPAKDFYDYEDKYVNGASKLEIPAKLDEDTMQKVRNMATEAFKGIDGRGLSRVDFFIEKETNKIYINEINTLPGFTNISMYPKLWDNTGIQYTDLIDNLIQLALEGR